MIAPNHLRFRGAPARRVDQSNAFAQGKSGAHNGQASGFAYIHSDSVRALAFRAFFPFHLKSYARNDSTVGAQFFPPFFKRLTGREVGGIYCRIGGHADLVGCGFVLGRVQQQPRYFAGRVQSIVLCTYFWASLCTVDSAGRRADSDSRRPEAVQPSKNTDVNILSGFGLSLASPFLLWKFY